MYWYNPTTHSSEKMAAPSSDSQAIQMLAGTKDSAQFVKEYYKLRRSGTPIEQALLLVGHKFRLRQPEYQLVLRYRLCFAKAESSSQLRRTHLNSWGEGLLRKEEGSTVSEDRSVE